MKGTLTDTHDTKHRWKDNDLPVVIPNDPDSVDLEVYEKRTLRS